MLQDLESSRTDGAEAPTMVDLPGNESLAKSTPVAAASREPLSKLLKVENSKEAEQRNAFTSTFLRLGFAVGTTRVFERSMAVHPGKARRQQLKTSRSQVFTCDTHAGDGTTMAKERG